MSHRSVEISAFRTARVFGIGVLCLFSAASIALAQFEELSTIEPLDSASRKKLEEQRKLVSTLARRYVGSTITGSSLNDLRTVQLLFARYPTRDRRLAPFGELAGSDNDRIYEIQALGVVLGDVMAREFDLEWVVFEDKFGRGRALNVKGTKDLVFPVTMLSKRYEVSLPVDVRAIYDEVAATLSIRPEKPKRRKLPVRPTIPEE